MFAGSCLKWPLRGSDGGDGAAGVGPGHCLESRFKSQGQSDDTLRGRKRHGIEGSFGDLTVFPQCGECLWLSLILEVGVCAGGVDQGPSGKDRATTRCAGEHVMASELKRIPQCDESLRLSWIVGGG